MEPIGSGVVEEDRGIWSLHRRHEIRRLIRYTERLKPARGAGEKYVHYEPIEEERT
jgi:hypothetical protein